MSAVGSTPTDRLDALTPSGQEPRHGGHRRIELFRAGWGLALVVAPRWMLEHVNHVTTDRPSVVVARVLGVRHLAQAALSGFDPPQEVLATGVWVDVVHAGSAMGLAAVDRDRARGGLTDAAVALAWAAFGYRDLARTPAGDRGERRRDSLARAVLARLPGGRFLLDVGRGDPDSLV